MSDTRLNPTYDRHSRNPLSQRHLWAFEGDSLQARLGRAVCRARCVPRKEFYEAWEVAKRVRRRFRGGRVVDLAAGHGLLGAMLLVLDPTRAGALCVDLEQPPSHARMVASLAEDWPRVGAQLRYLEGPLESVPLQPGDVVVSAHACGALTDRVLERAVDAEARVAVLPCCHPKELAPRFAPWVGPLGAAVDAARAMRLEQRGYRVWCQTIPEDITPENRLLLAEPT